MSQLPLTSLPTRLRVTTGLSLIDDDDCSDSAKDAWRMSANDYQFAGFPPWVV